MVLIAPTDKIWVEEEADEEDEEDKDEGGSVRGEGVVEEEEVGREREDITNLGRTTKEAQVGESRSGFRAELRKKA